MGRPPLASLRGGAKLPRYCTIPCGVLKEGDSRAEPDSFSALSIFVAATVAPAPFLLLVLRAFTHCCASVLALVSSGAYRNHMGILCSAAVCSRPETLTLRLPRVELMLSQTAAVTLFPSGLLTSGTGTF